MVYVCGTCRACWGLSGCGLVSSRALTAPTTNPRAQPCTHPAALHHSMVEHGTLRARSRRSGQVHNPSPLSMQATAPTEPQNVIVRAAPSRLIACMRPAVRTLSTIYCTPFTRHCTPRGREHLAFARMVQHMEQKRARGAACRVQNPSLPPLCIREGSAGAATTRTEWHRPTSPHAREGADEATRHAPV